MASAVPIAIILAAGQGLRLAPLTSDRPKALVDIHGVSLLERSIRALTTAGFRRAMVVTGYRADAIVDFLLSRKWDVDVSVRFNPQFATSNNIVSLLAVTDVLADGFCLLNSDIIFDAELLVEIAELDVGSWLSVDLRESLDAEDMKIELDDGGAIRRISKELAPATSAGEYIGIARFDAAGAGVVLDAARELVESGGTQLYYEDAFDRAATSLYIRPVQTRGRLWTEVDNLSDRDRAVRIAEELDGSTTD
ncbi:NTP transferase domain-containing protein [soil metagenome]